MAECPGVDPVELETVAARLKRDYPALLSLDNAAEAIALGSLALQQLEICRLRYHAELVDCITDFQHGQEERRKRMGGNAK